MNVRTRGRSLVRLTAQLAVVVAVVSLVAANIWARSTWSEMEDGVLWAAVGEDVTATRVASNSPAERSGIEAGDILFSIGSTEVRSAQQVIDRLHAAGPGEALTYTIIRTKTQQQLPLQVAPIPAGSRALYYALAAVGLFSLLVGAAVRFRRPDNQATLHFFWLTVAFCGVLGLSFSGQLDTLDWVFYWGDVVSMLLLPPLFAHFALVFPERPDSWARSDAGRALLPLVYLPGLLLGAGRVATMMRSGRNGGMLSSAIALIERLEIVYLAVSLLAGLGIMILALRRVRSVTARRQLRWIVGGTLLGALPFVFGYALPWTLGFHPLGGFEFTAVLLGLVPLAFASAIVRYRLMDVEVIIKRALVYSSALAAIAAIYGILLTLATKVFLGGNDSKTGVIALLATMVVIVATLAQVGWLKLRGRRIDTMLWVSLGLVVVLGGATIYFHNETFIKWKPSMLYWAMGLSFWLSPLLFGKNLLRLLLGEQLELPPKVWHRLNFAWIAFFAVMGFLNIWVAYTFSTGTWVNFKLFGSIGLMLAFTVAQGLYLQRYIKDEPVPEKAPVDAP